MLVLLQGAKVSRVGRPPGPGYSRYVDFLDIHGSWCLVSHLALELGLSDLAAKRQVNRLVVAGRVEKRVTDRGPEVRSNA